jgi:hypothetical protein
MKKKRMRWDYIQEHDQRETDVEAWQTVEVGRRGTDSILSIGYDLQNRAEIEEWANEYGFAVQWR